LRAQVAADRAVALAAHALEAGRAVSCADIVVAQAEANEEQAATIGELAATIVERHAKRALLEAAAATTPSAEVQDQDRGFGCILFQKRGTDYISKSGA
jgi:hypothetical protein